MDWGLIQGVFQTQCSWNNFQIHSNPEMYNVVTDENEQKKRKQILDICNEIQIQNRKRNSQCFKKACQVY